MISYDELKPVVDRLFNRTATIADRLTYVRFELQEIMKALPPDATDNESDGWHASACALRAFSVVIGLERELAAGAKREEPASSGAVPNLLEAAKLIIPDMRPMTPEEAASSKAMCKKLYTKAAAREEPAVAAQRITEQQVRA